MARNCDQRCTCKNSWLKNIALGALVFSFSSSFVHARTLVDRLVADVNGEAIVYSDIKTKMDRGREIMITEFPATKEDSDLIRSLQDQINFELMLQKAEQLEINFDDSQVENFIVKNLSPGSTLDSLREALRRENISFEDYKSDVRDQMILMDFQQKVIRPLVKVSDKDIENYYLRKSGSGSQSVSVNLKQLVVSAAALKGDVDAARKQADSAYAQVKSGLSFDEAVKKFSTDDAAKKTGGAMSEMKLSELNDTLKSQIEPLSTGEHTGLIQIESNFYIFFVENRKLSASNDYEAQKPQLHNELLSQRITAQTISWISDERRRIKPKMIPE